MRTRTVLVLPGLAMMLLAAGLRGQQTAPPATTQSGCVMRTEAGDYTLAKDGVCSVLTGVKVDPALIGHLVTLRGAVQEATSSTPRTVTSIGLVSVGGACSLSCSPHPPGHRGLGHEKPGSEGGTPGAAPAPHPQ